MDWITRSAWRYFTLIFLLSLVIRVNQLNQLNRSYLVPSDDRELGAIAISLMKSGEFGNTFIIPTGLTAHLPPIPPLKDSLIYRAFGLTSRAGYVRALSIIITASVLYGLLPWFSERLGTGKAAGVVAGLGGALGGLISTIEDKLPGHGEHLTALLMAFLRRWQRRSGAGWVLSCWGWRLAPLSTCSRRCYRSSWAVCSSNCGGLKSGASGRLWG